MVPAVRPLGPLSMARGCARIDSRPDTAKIGSADRVEVHHARLLAVIGVRKTFPHGLDPQRTLGNICPGPYRRKTNDRTARRPRRQAEVGLFVCSCAGAASPPRQEFHFMVTERGADTPSSAGYATIYRCF